MGHGSERCAKDLQTLLSKIVHYTTTSYISFSIIQYCKDTGRREGCGLYSLCYHPLVFLARCIFFFGGGGGGGGGGEGSLVMYVDGAEGRCHSSTAWADCRRTVGEPSIVLFADG